MATDSPSYQLFDSSNDSSFYNDDFFQSFEQPGVVEPGEIASYSNVNWELGFLRDEKEPDPVVQYINQILLEENMEEGELWMFQDPLALQTTEKSFYDVLAKDSFIPSPHEPLISNVNAEVQDSSTTWSSSDLSAARCAATTTTGWENYEPSVGRNSVTHFASHSCLQTSLTRQSDSFSDFHVSLKSAQMDAFAKPNTMTPSIFSDSDSILLFQRGLEEGSKFLPPVSQVIGDSAKYKTVLSLEPGVNAEKNEMHPEFHKGFRGRKHSHTDDDELNYLRSSKQHATAVSVPEDELSDKFDRVLLNHIPPEDLKIDNASHEVQSAHKNSLLSGGKNRARKTRTGIDTPNLSELLMSCAQSVAANDEETANEQLNLIKKYASTTGDPEQRLAILFANALEARLAGTGTEQHIALTSRRISAAEELRAYRVYHFTPFKAIPVIFGNQMILQKASKATTLHIVDFGIGFGFQWPSLIQHLSQRPGGPPKLRITGIETPQPGFRPGEVVEDTGRRLARYCKRFRVPFEYHAIATQSWEKIRVEELKVTRGEVVVVNTQFRFKNLLDETVVAEESPKDAALNLIRNLNPDLLMNFHVNAQHGSPFFVNRFREAFFFFSAMFDAIDNLLPRDDEVRFKFEHDFFAAQIMNLVACEGKSRVERPESYKQWQTRCMRAGFKLVPLRQGLMKDLRKRVKKLYHKDFVFDEDGCWMLLGWKGRIITAISCWIPGEHD